MKFIIITGGVISGIGKGTIGSSLGYILKQQDQKVTYIKIDPYLNVDAGTMNPYEHGEVFVLKDGTECDLDLGCYERFLDTDFSKHNNITTGQIYQSVINKERAGGYLGQTIQVVPHITDEIKSRIVYTSSLGEFDVCIIELGGTINDIETQPFIEALRQLGLEYDCTFCHISYVPFITSTSCHKTKPTQESVMSFRSKGIPLDILFCRSNGVVSQENIDKISLLCGIKRSKIICVPDTDINVVPNVLFHQDICGAMGIKTVNASITTQLNTFSTRVLPIAIVGKYTENTESYLSITHACRHALFNVKVNADIRYITMSDFINSFELYSAVILAPGFGERGLEEKIQVAKVCLEQKIPTLGICFGFQAMVINYTRQFLGMCFATSQEVSDNPDYIVIKRLSEGMRLGDHVVHLKDNCVAKRAYGDKMVVVERHRHRYGLYTGTHFTNELEKNGLVFSGHGANQEAEICEVHDHPYYVGVQFHPEFSSRFNSPSPVFVELIRSIGRGWPVCG